MLKFWIYSFKICCVEFHFRMGAPCNKQNNSSNSNTHMRCFNFLEIGIQPNFDLETQDVDQISMPLDSCKGKG